MCDFTSVSRPICIRIISDVYLPGNSAITFLIFFNMSRGNMLLGYSRGKVGDVVFSRRLGEQVARAYNGKPRNANTRGQAAQRSQLSNIVVMYRAAIRLLDHSFTSRKPNQTSYNAFVSRNLGTIPVYVPKAMAAAGGCVVAPYVVSDGTLPSIQTSGMGVETVTNISLGQLTIGNETTIAEFTQTLVSNNANILVGDQLSYISFVQATNPDTGYPQVSVGLYEVTLSLYDTRLLLDIMPSYGCKTVSGYLGHGEKVADGGFCWILSRKDGQGALTCSRQSIIVTSSSVYQQFIGDVAMTKAISSYGANEPAFLLPGASSSSGTVTIPSIASVKIGETSPYLSSALSKFTVPSAGSQVVTIDGSYLSTVEQVTVTINGTTMEASNVVADSETKVTANVTIPDDIAGKGADNISVALNGNVLFTWAKASGGSDDEEEVPFG